MYAGAGETWTMLLPFFNYAGMALAGLVPPAYTRAAAASSSINSKAAVTAAKHSGATGGVPRARAHRQRTGAGASAPIPLPDAGVEEASGSSAAGARRFIPSQLLLGPLFSSDAGASASSGSSSSRGSALAPLHAQAGLEAVLSPASLLMMPSTAGTADYGGGVGGGSGTTGQSIAIAAASPVPLDSDASSGGGGGSDDAEAGYAGYRDENSSGSEYDDTLGMPAGVSARLAPLALQRLHSQQVRGRPDEVAQLPLLSCCSLLSSHLSFDYINAISLTGWPRRPRHAHV
jgi:hypothetical protein